MGGQQCRVLSGQSLVKLILSIWDMNLSCYDIGMLIYLDNCCLNRPFDDQSSPRIHLEAEAVKTVINLIESGEWQLVTSPVLQLEINKTSNEKKRRSLHGINNLAVDRIEIGSDVKNRAKQFEVLGIQAFDAAHLACAENNADVLLTVDVKFIKRANAIEGLGITVMNPLQWLEEVLK